jgi:Xaa-Pro aminopeptidase
MHDSPETPGGNASTEPRPDRTGSDFFPEFSDRELARRHDMVRAGMRARGLDCLVVYGFHHYNGNDTGQTNIVYLANFANVVQTYVVFPVDAEPSLVVGLPFHVSIARKLSYIQDIVADPGLAQGMIACVRKHAKPAARIGLVGYTPGLTLPYEHREQLTASVADASYEDVTGWLLNLRLVLSEEEIALMQRAATLSDHVHEQVHRATRVGATHSEVCRVVGVEAMKAGGHWALSHVGATPMSDPEAYYPDFYATHEAFRPGDVCQTEFAIGYGNYMVKTTTSCFIGEPTGEYRMLFEVAAEIQNRCIDGLKPGMTGKDVNRFTEPAVSAGLSLSQPIIGGYSTYNTAPWAGAVPGKPLERLCKPFDDFVFEPGQSLFVIGTPHIPGTRKGVWAGQTCLVTESGLKRLCSYPVDEIRTI